MAPIEGSQMQRNTKKQTDREITKLIYSNFADWLSLIKFTSKSHRFGMLHQDQLTHCRLFWLSMYHWIFNPKLVFHTRQNSKCAWGTYDLRKLTFIVQYVVHIMNFCTGLPIKEGINVERIALNLPWRAFKKISTAYQSAIWWTLLISRN